MKSVGIKVLNNRLREYVRLATSGETILVTDHDQVVAELGPLRETPRQRRLLPRLRPPLSTATSLSLARPVTAAQRRGVVVDLTSGGPVALRAVVRRLGTVSAATVVVHPADRVPVILDQPGRPPRRLAPGFGFEGGSADLYSAYLRTEAPGGAARVRLVSR